MRRSSRLHLRKTAARTDVLIAPGSTLVDRGETLLSIDGRVTHRDAGSNAALLVTKHGIEFHDDDGATLECHARPFAQVKRINQLPTPWVGTVERIHLYTFFLWIGVLAVVLIRRHGRNVADRK